MVESGQSQEYLGSRKFSKSKMYFWIITLLATVYVLFILVLKWNDPLFTSELKSTLFSHMIPSLICIIGLAISGFFTFKKREKWKILTPIFVVILALSIFFVRQLISDFYVLPLPEGIGRSIIYTTIGLISTIIMGYNVFFPRVNSVIDSVTSEEKEKAPIKASWKTKILIGIGIFIFTFLWISGTKSAFVQAPLFSFYDKLYQEAWLSGIVGGIQETSFFFGIIMPTLYAILNKITRSKILSIIVTIIGITALAVAFHTTVYKYNSPALITVGFFFFANSLITMFLRDNFLNMEWHFLNNFLVVIFAIQKFSIFLVF